MTPLRTLLIAPPTQAEKASKKTALKKAAEAEKSAKK
jgi:hypothetical protein